MPCSGIVGQVFLQQEEIVGLPHRRIGGEDRIDVCQRLHDVDSGAAAALVGLEDGRPSNSIGVRTKRTHVVERNRPRRVDAQRPQQCRLCALAQLEREDVGAVQHPRAQSLERPHVGQRQRDGARVAADVGARARLIEVQLRGR